MASVFSVLSAWNSFTLDIHMAGTLAFLKRLVKYHVIKMTFRDHTKKLQGYLHLQCSHPRSVFIFIHIFPYLGLPCSSNGKESACDARDQGLIPGSGRSSGEGNGNPLQYSCLGNSMDRGAWQATVHGVTKSRTRLSNQHFLRVWQWPNRSLPSWNWHSRGGDRQSTELRSKGCRVRPWSVL